MNVKKLLKQNSQKIMPSEGVSRKIKADCGAVQADVYHVGGGVAVKSRRKVGVSVVAVGAAAVIATTAILLAIRNINPTIPDNTFNFGTISSATDFYAYSAVSVGGMLNNSSSSTAEASTFSCYYSTGVTSEQKQILNKYTMFASGVLGEGKIVTSYEVADKVGYEYKLGIGYSDGFGVNTDSVLYFNKVVGSESYEDGEEEFAIVGELVSGDTTYLVEGEYENEIDEDETESEVEFIVYTTQDKQSYIKIEYEQELDASTKKTETEFVISVYKDGKRVEKAKVKSETGKKTAYEVAVNKSDGENIKIKYNQKQSDDKKILGVNASFGSEEYKLIVNPRHDKDDTPDFDFVDFEEWDKEDVGDKWESWEDMWGDDYDFDFDDDDWWFDREGITDNSHGGKPQDKNNRHDKD